MSEYDVLMLMAELSLGLVGFSGIVVALQTRGAVRVGVVYMLQTACALVLLSILPIVLKQFDVSSDRIWLISSIAASCYMIVINVIAHLRLELTAKGPLYRAVVFCFYLFALLGIINAWPQSFAVYLVILVWLLLYCLILFVRLITSVQES